MSLIVFTDLDGTLLDHHDYSWQAARPALRALQEAGTPLVLCSSKTRAEMIPLWERLDLASPFISENGGGVFAPSGHPYILGGGWRPAGGDWLVHAIGMPISDLRGRLAGFAQEFGARGFGQMSDAEVAELTGLSLEDAARARQREFNEPVVLPHPERDAGAFAQAAHAAGLEVTRGGRFFHLLGGGDKGKAVRLVMEWHTHAHGPAISAALGDSLNDLPMLAAVGHPFLVARPDGSHAEMDLPGLVRQAGIGPAGFNAAVLGLMGEAA